MKATFYFIVFALIAGSGSASRSFNGTNQRVTASNSVLNTNPITVAAWFYSTSNSSFQVIAARGKSTAGGGAHYYRLAIRGDQPGDYVEFVKSGGAVDARSSGAYTTNTWQHAVGVSSSDVSHRVYLNGVAGTIAGGTSSNHTDADTFDIGAWNATGTVTGFFSGMLADVAIWDAELSADEIGSLSKGISPLLVRPGALVFYAPLARELVDFRGAASLTNNGSTEGTTHPRTYQ